MKKKIFLHIGTHRAGSTSIQRFLALADNVLFDKGVLYPETGRPDTKWSNQYGQHKLALSIAENKGASRKLWESLREEVESYSSKKIILSSEEFENCKQPEVRHILDNLPPYPVRVVVFLRPPMDLLRSKYKNRQKMGTYSKSFDRFVEEMTSHCNYLDLVSQWEQFSEVEAVDIRLFDKVKNDPGLEQSFANAVGIDFKEVREFAGSPANASPPDDLIQVARWINAAAAFGKEEGPWQVLTSRARDNVLGPRWPGTWLASVMQPFLRNSLVTSQAIKVLREELEDAHRHFLDKYVDPDDRHYLPL